MQKIQQKQQIPSWLDYVVYNPSWNITEKPFIDIVYFIHRVIQKVVSRLHQFIK
jgi:hypothetical protein